MPIPTAVPVAKTCFDWAGDEEDVEVGKDVCDELALVVDAEADAAAAEDDASEVEVATACSP